MSARRTGSTCGRARASPPAFLGDSNLIDGRDHGRGADWIEVATSFGVVRKAGSASVGGEVALAVRPEQLVADRSGADLWQLGEAVVADAMFLGTYWRVLAVVRNQRRQTAAAPAATQAPGAGDRMPLAVASVALRCSREG